MVPRQAKSKASHRTGKFGSSHVFLQCITIALTFYPPVGHVLREGETRTFLENQNDVKCHLINVYTAGGPGNDAEIASMQSWGIVPVIIGGIM